MNRQARFRVRGPVREQVSMAELTVWGVGGRAQHLFEPVDLSDLAGFLSMTDPNEPLLFMGLGSNLLVRDGGFQGTVIVIAKNFDHLSVGENTTLSVGAGVACPKVARFCANKGLGGAEFFAGIPGTVGGALAMNAGAYGDETWRLVREVETINRQGDIATRIPENYTVGYREVIGPENEWFVSAKLNLISADPLVLRESVRELLRKRALAQPLGQRSCGSVFRNPEGDFAGRLIECCGLKGSQSGRALVSTKHANFIINSGDASARDIETLMIKVATTVEQMKGVRLAPEVRIVGEP